jgi:lysylphosphatidylglycerol synthetase-like protein (DUF2156 family)
MIKKIKQIIGFLGLSALIAIPSLFGAQNVVASSTSLDNLNAVAQPGYGSGTNEDTLLNTIAGIIKTVLSLLGFIFVILVIYAGITWMTAAGNDKQIATARNILTRAVIGLIIVVLAYAITYFIFTNLPGGDGAGVA